jgi:hypothetical protein
MKYKTPLYWVSSGFNMGDYLLGYLRWALHETKTLATKQNI